MELLAKESQRLKVSNYAFTQLKGALSRVRQFLSAGKPFKIDDECFHFMSEALFILKIFIFFYTFWSCSKTA